MIGAGLEGRGLCCSWGVQNSLPDMSMHVSDWNIVLYKLMRYIYIYIDAVPEGLGLTLSVHPA